MSANKRSAEKYALVTPKPKDAKLDPKKDKYIVWYTWCDLGECHPVYITASAIEAQKAVDAIYADFAVWRAAGGDYHSRDPADGFAFFFTETTPVSPVLYVDADGNQRRVVWVGSQPDDRITPWYSYREEDVGEEVEFKVHKYLPDEFTAEDMRDFSFAHDVELTQDDKVLRAYWVGVRSLAPNTLEMLRRIYPKSYTKLRHEREFPEEKEEPDGDKDVDIVGVDPAVPAVESVSPRGSK